MAALHCGRILHNLLWQRCCSIMLQALVSPMLHIGGHNFVCPGTRRETCKHDARGKHGRVSVTLAT
jgi:hypothetical protein